MNSKSVPVQAQVDYNLLSFIAHESRGPFNGLIGFSELLYTNQSSLSPEQQESYSELVHQLAVKSFFQLQTFIAWTKLISNNLVLQPGIILIPEWIQQVVSYLRVDLISKHIELNHTPTSLSIKGDQQLLSVALANLIYSALRYIGENCTIDIESLPSNQSITLKLPYSEQFETLLNNTALNPNEQTEQNYRIWVAYQLFERSGIHPSCTTENDKSMLIIQLSATA